MKISRFALPVLFLATFLFSTSTYAQEMKSGIWTGLMLPPGGEEVEVSFDVAYAADTLKISMIAEGIGSFPFSDVTLTESDLSFSFQPGPLVLCELSKKANGDYEGACAPGGGEEGILIMSPPKDDK